MGTRPRGTVALAVAAVTLLFLAGYIRLTRGIGLWHGVVLAVGVVLVLFVLRMQRRAG